MTFIERLELIKRIDALINRKATGNPSQLAARLMISRASVFRYINELKAIGAPVVYCCYRESYFYEEPFELKF
jgi:predicted DNA-binding transcriptional regulator YafY